MISPLCELPCNGVSYAFQLTGHATESNEKNIFAVSYERLTSISAYIHDRNEIPTAIPMFSRSGNTTEVLRRMPDLENIDIAVGTSLLLCIEAETYVISNLLPVIGSHL